MYSKRRLILSKMAKVIPTSSTTLLSRGTVPFEIYSNGGATCIESSYSFILPDLEDTIDSAVILFCLQSLHLSLDHINRSVCFVNLINLQVLPRTEAPPAIPPAKNVWRSSGRVVFYFIFNHWSCTFNSVLQSSYTRNLIPWLLPCFMTVGKSPL
jgi:hypothetical protein